MLKPISAEYRLRFVNRLVCIICMLVLSTTFLTAQTSRGTVSGIIKDPNGAVVPGAQVTLTNSQTSVERTSTTNDEGFYRFDAVDLGTYSVKTSAANFSTLVTNDIIVRANQTSAIDINLTVGEQTNVVEVTSDNGAILQTEAPVRGGNVSTRQITELPFADNPVALALTLPGVSTNRTTLGIGTFSVNGARGRSNNFLIDGTENNDISVAGQGFQITNEDAVAEVAIQTSNFDSEFGRSGGAVVNVITKSGTKDFHGTLAFEYDSSADDAITSSVSRIPGIVTPDASGNVRGRPPTNTQFVPAATFGGPLFLPNFGNGGPVFNTNRDKNFFFVAYEETRFRQPGAFVNLIVPTAAGRAVLQNYAANNPLLATYLNLTAGSIAPTADQGSVSLDSTTTPTGRPSVQIGTFTRNYTTLFTDKQFQVRTDHALSGKDQVSFRFLRDSQLQPKGGEAAFEGFDTDFSALYYNFLASETHVFNATTTNELRLAYNRIVYGFPLSTGGIQSSLPLITPGNGLTSLGSGTALPQGRIANNYQVQDTVTKVFGNHTIRGGVDYLRQIASQIAPANIRGSFAYAAAGGYQALGNFVDDFGGTNGSAQRFFGPQTYNPTLHRIAGFLQDRWKATSALTLTGGLRYEYFGVPFNTLYGPAYTGLFNVNASTRQGPYNQPNKVQKDTNNFGPTVGIAYSPSYTDGILGRVFGEKKSVIRAGYQIGYDSFFNNIASNAATAAPNGILTINTSTVVAGTAPRGQANFSSQLPTTAGIILPTSAQTTIDPNLVNPYYQRYSLGMQRELPYRIIMDVSYVGSRGTKLFATEDLNPLVRPELRSAIPAGYPTCTIGTNLTAANAQPPLFPAGTLCPITGRLDNIQGARTVRTNGGASSYNSGQLSVTRRFSNNFLITGAYTFSKFISNADEVFAAGLGTTAQNFAIPGVLGGERNDRALSIFDRTHRASFTYVIRSPFFTEQRGFVGKVLGGFELSGVTVFESGAPYTVLNGFDSDGIGGNFDRPTYNPNGTKGVRAIPIVDANNNIISYYNPEIVTARNAAGTPTAFQAIDPATAEFIVNPAYVAGGPIRTGNLGRNTERSPGIENTDLTLSKITRVGERLSIKLRADLFNAFNHPQFPAGASNAGAVTQGFFLNPDTVNSTGGGRVVRYQVKLIF